MIFRYIFMALIVFIISFLLIQFQNGSIYEEIPSSKYSFAGQVVPMWWKYFFNQEKMDREISLIKFDTAQFVMLNKRIMQFVPYIEDILQKNWVHKDLKYLAMVESYLRTNIVSSVGAAWIRQLMPDTARQYWLRVDDTIDERYDRQKSTQAAAKYLRNLFETFKDRNLVAAAYNRWQNWLERDMSWQWVTWYYDLLLNDETSRFVFKIVAMKYLMGNKTQNFDTTVLWGYYTTPSTKIITLGATTWLSNRATTKGYNYLQLRQLNPWIRSDDLPEWERDLKVFK